MTTEKKKVRKPKVTSQKPVAEVEPEKQQEIIDKISPVPEASIVEPEVRPAPIIEPEKPQGPVLGDLQIGRIFRANGKMWKKINHLGAQCRVQDVTASDSDTVMMDSSTLVAPWTAGHEVEGEM